MKSSESYWTLLLASHGRSPFLFIESNPEEASLRRKRNGLIDIHEKEGEREANV